MARVAVVSEVPVFPVDAGNRSRILTFTRALRAIGHEVVFLRLGRRPLGEAVRAAHHAEFGPDRVMEHVLTERERLTFRFTRELRDLGRRLLRVFDEDLGHHNGIDELCPRSYVRAVAAAHASRRFEAVVVEYAAMSRVLGVFGPEVLRIIDTHDRFADRHRSYLGEGVGYWYSVSPRTEAATLRRADVVLAIQDEEAAAFRRDVGDGVEIVTVGHLLDLAAPIDRDDGVGAVVVGSNNATNVHSVARFLDTVLPRILGALPDFRLHLVGRICEEVPDRPGVVRHGFVDDLRRAFEVAPIAINPSLLGTGINIKLLEGMAFGVAGVTTRIGARGLPETLRDGLVIVPDDDPAAFAEAVVALAGDPRRRAAAAARSRAAAAAWNEVQVRALGKVMERIGGRGGRSDPVDPPSPRADEAARA
ncbi:MAG: glycosyltransferase family 4 protein [Siculibacillus sp.]|nr:glycosyltransferase family 4 protein [Siculibacillus sp.]